MFIETKRPWWSWILLIAPCVMGFGILQLSQSLLNPDSAVVEEQNAQGEIQQRELTPAELADEKTGQLIGIAVLSVAAVVMFWIFLSTRIFRIEASDLGIRFGYLGIWSKNFSRQEIAMIRPTECRFREFLGLGIRWGLGTKRLGYVCWFGAGVHLELTNGKKYAFSCHDPQACITALNLTPGQLGPCQEKD